jgi:hypothetical protein
MQKLLVDWAGEGELPEGVDRDDPNVRVEVVQAKGPAGWPVLAVYASRDAGEPAYRESMRLDGWLRDVYGMEDEDERQDMLTMAEVV